MKICNVMSQQVCYHAQINKKKGIFASNLICEFFLGLTPARKNFSYPRQFKVTSPHEQILKKFRESRKFLETTDDDVSDTCDKIYFMYS